MWSHQLSIPRLPVPPLKQTLERYLLALQPILSTAELEKSKTLVEDFGKPGGLGEKLQELLVDRSKIKDNWLADWWLDVAYLGYRSPVVINSSPGLCLPFQNYNDLEGQLRCAVNLLSGLLDYKELIDTNKLPVEYMGNQPMCMMQYYKVLSSCRIPGVSRDSVICYPPDQPDAPKHIIVVHNNYFFAVQVYGNDNKVLNEKQLYDQLKDCTNQSMYSGKQIGILTTESRNSWGKIYKKMQKDVANKAALEMIQRSICVLCLDGPELGATDDDRLRLLGKQMLHGGGSTLNSGNRWYDKTLQVIVGRNGTAGFCYEHSAAEGPPIASIIDHAYNYQFKSVPKLPADNVIKPVRLEFNIDSKITEGIEAAKTHLDVAISDLEVVLFKFADFGKNFPKSCKISPDAFIQVALQLGYYRLHGTTVATYESGSTRKFQLGRTDTIRSASIASKEFCERVMSSASDQELAALLRKACERHKTYTNQALNGMAIDRHLLGLKLIAIENGMNVPDIFMDTSYTTAMHFNISTSQVPLKIDASLVFGAVVPDGYGFCYNPREDSINISITSYYSSPETSSAKLRTCVEQSLQEMKSIMLREGKSKL